MNRNLAIALAAGLLAATPAAAFTIQFDYGYDTGGFFSSHPNAQTDLQAAGHYFETRITDTLSAITSGGPNHFTASFTDPATGNPTSISDYSVPADTLVVFVGGQNLGGSALGQGGPGGFSVSGTQSFVDAAAYRGQAGAAASPPTDFGPWGGSITFDSGANWYFDPDPATDESFSGYDFYSVALHELGHVLGIGTADSWYALVSGGSFTGSAAQAAYGGPVPVNGGADHWAGSVAGLLPDGTLQEAAMTPAIGPHQRKRFTDVDLAALSDVGWQVVAVPEPTSLALVATPLLLLALRRRSA
ncbi:MAG: peptidase M10A and M12B matrixin and adamalysin [Nitrospirae bacterium]|nr:MAG: peptidase M10A and M12B matrixin and adamalysin [Nitrospirota bacterium]